MKKTVIGKATPAAIAVLRQATAIAPKRMKACDGLLPSAAHLKASPTSDHNTGLAVDLTHDPDNDINCHEVYAHLKSDKRVKYLIFKGRIWSAEKGDRRMTKIEYLLYAAILAVLLGPGVAAEFVKKIVHKVIMF